MKDRLAVLMTAACVAVSMGLVTERLGAAETLCRDGVWRVEKKNLTRGEVSPGERLDVLLGSYWAHLGLSGDARISELRHIEGPGKFRLVYSWHPEKVGDVRDRSVGWKETCDGERMVQVSREEPMEGGEDRVQYTYRRIATQRGELDGVWTVRLENLTKGTSLAEPMIWIRYGEYQVWFHQPPGGKLVSSLERAISPGRWKAVLGTDATEVDRVSDRSYERSEEANDRGWVIQWRAARSETWLGLPIEKADRLQATLVQRND